MSNCGMCSRSLRILVRRYRTDMNRKRSNLEVMMRLIGLVKPLTGYMILAISMGLIGHLCAAFLTVLAGYGILHIIGLY